MITKDIIIKGLQEKMIKQDYVYAMWLEGSDANGGGDEFSDIDIYLDVEDKDIDKSIEYFEEALSQISKIDFKHIMKHPHPKLRQRIYHIENTSEYLMLDIVWQLHSRKPEETTYYKNSKIENAEVIFDKVGIIRYEDFNISQRIDKIKDLINDIEYRYNQHVRVIKYIKRGKYLEAYMYYNRYVVDPLIGLLRIIYTPSHIDYGMCQISNHLPRKYINNLEYLVKNKNFEDMQENLILANKLYNELIKEVKSKF